MDTETSRVRAFAVDYRPHRLNITGPSGGSERVEDVQTMEYFGAPEEFSTEQVQAAESPFTPKGIEPPA